MTHWSRSAPSERGQAQFSVVLVVVAVVLAAILLTRVASTAEDINEKAGRIQKTALPIGEATKAVAGGNLDKTNSLAGSILTSAKPLEGQLAEIVRLAQSVDRTAASINGLAGEIDVTATGINGTAVGILDTARSIDRGVQQIITNLNDTLALATTLKNDLTGNILAQAVTAHRRASCIDQGIPGGSGDGHCR